MEEIWKPIRGYEGIYEVSTNGKVRSLERIKCVLHGKKKFRHETELKLQRLYNGYLYIDLHKERRKKRYFVHRLVAEAFIPNPKELTQINHKDGDKTNNTVDNLEWCSPSDNIKHSCRILHARPEYVVRQFSKNGELIEEYANTGIASENTGIGRSNILSCLIGRQKSAGGFIWKRG